MLLANAFEVDFVEHADDVSLEESEDEQRLGLSDPNHSNCNIFPRRTLSPGESASEDSASSRVGSSLSSLLDRPSKPRFEQCVTQSAVHPLPRSIVRDGVTVFSRFSPRRGVAAEKNFETDESSAGLNQIHANPPVWPLTDVIEATLFRHFIDDLSPFVSPGLNLSVCAKPNGLSF